MRIGIALPNYGPLAAPDVLASLAREAETLGVDSVWVSDHLVAPRTTRSIYPYDRRPDARPGDMAVIERFFEPTVTLAFLAGHTSRVRLGVSAYVVPYRNPVVTAKQIATLDVLSGGRAVLAVGTGWLREEFEALGVPFARRGLRTDEYLAVCRALWRGGDAEFEGSCYRLPPVRTGPPPLQQPHPPLWIAGNSTAAMERAARAGDGWHAIDLAPAELAPRVATLRQRIAAHGRRREDVAVSLRKGVLVGADSSRPLYGDAAKVRRDLDAYREAGLDYLVVGLRQAKTAGELSRAIGDVVAAIGR